MNVCVSEIYQAEEVRTKIKIQIHELEDHITFLGLEKVSRSCRDRSVSSNRVQSSEPKQKRQACMSLQSQHRESKKTGGSLWLDYQSGLLACLVNVRSVRDTLPNPLKGRLCLKIDTQAYL